jgi:3-hydroxyacyl-[acyl-carrier-protein] dehydratase
MLLNDLYTIEDLQTEPGDIKVVLLLDAAHPIFSGHFPGQPVLPGACAIQMVRELLGHALGKNYRLIKADQIKFLSMVDPRDQQRLLLDLHYAEVEEGLRVTAALSAGGNSCVKLTGIFRVG